MALPAWFRKNKSEVLLKFDVKIQYTNNTQVNTITYSRVTNRAANVFRDVVYEFAGKKMLMVSSSTTGMSHLIPLDSLIDMTVTCKGEYVNEQL